MKASRAVFLIGLLLYIGSFFLIAVKESGASTSASGYHGYWCAYTTLVGPWGHSGLELLREDALLYFAILFSGWINPVFLITAAMLWAKPKGRIGAFLRIVVVLLMPACWVVFHQYNVSPRPGYWLWTAAMLAVLFSTMLAREKRDVNVAAVAA
ncbi:MAG TPA: hypothetical protein VKE93_05705 [Candidatus Angelobacter sp.]|nr:hypothetical protein [Candidatus Angelobacter sp.]